MMDGFMSDIPQIAEQRALHKYAKHLLENDTLVKAILNSETLERHAKQYLLIDYLMLAHIEKPPLQFSFLKLGNSILFLWQKANTPNWIQTTSGPGFDKDGA